MWLFSGERIETQNVPGSVSLLYYSWRWSWRFRSKSCFRWILEPSLHSPPVKYGTLQDFLRIWRFQYAYACKGSWFRRALPWRSLFYPRGHLSRFKFVWLGDEILQVSDQQTTPPLPEELEDEKTDLNLVWWGAKIWIFGFPSYLCHRLWWFQAYWCWVAWHWWLLDRARRSYVGLIQRCHWDRLGNQLVRSYCSSWTRWNYPRMPSIDDSSIF